MHFCYYEKIGNVTRNITEEIPFDIPDSWEWARLQNITIKIYAGGDKPSDMVLQKDGHHPYPVIANGIKNDGILGYTSISTATKGTITVAGRGTIGFSLYRDYDYCPVVRLIVLESYKGINPLYLHMVLEALPEKGLGTSIPQLTVPMITPKLIPVPPFKEQDKIYLRVQTIIGKLKDEV